jgi:sulfotransferase family protein
VSETRAAPWLRTSPIDEYRRLCAARLSHLVEARQPLVLISQIQRSGGTLLSQLFDGHPECHAHPQEVKIGWPKKRHWPPIDLDRPDEWFGLLYEEAAAEHLVRGYRKSPSPSGPDIFPFLFSPRLQRQVFDACVGAWPIGRERDVLDAYLTSYFNAWLDNHNLYRGPKKVVTGFTPQLGLEPGNPERFFAAYPDGTLLSIVRDPRAWFNSSREHKRDRVLKVDGAVGRWRTSVEAALAARERFGDRVLVLTYERLVGETETVMAALAERLGLTMGAVLLEPTFNGRPIRADSSYEVAAYGVLGDRVDKWRERLDPAAVERIDALAGDLYERAAASQFPAR